LSTISYYINRIKTEVKKTLVIIDHYQIFAANSVNIIAKARHRIASYRRRMTGRRWFAHSDHFVPDRTTSRHCPTVDLEPRQTSELHRSATSTLLLPLVLNSCLISAHLSSVQQQVL